MQIGWSRYNTIIACNFVIISDFPVQTKQQQSVKFLQLMVYTAAETDAQEFIEMVFNTSAGQVVFNSYKDRTPLPEEVARANGHEELAQYLQDVNTRYGKIFFVYLMQGNYITQSGELNLGFLLNLCLHARCIPIWTIFITRQCNRVFVAAFGIEIGEIHRKI